MNDILNAANDTLPHPIQILIYDNGGPGTENGSFDRYTVVYGHDVQGCNYGCVGMSENPFSPQGFGQHSTCQVGEHLGRLIKFSDLPPDCQKLVRQDLGGEHFECAASEEDFLNG